jgi:uncharacterized protein YjbJ (UPF0337 family)
MNIFVKISTGIFLALFIVFTGTVVYKRMNPISNIERVAVAKKEQAKKTYDDFNKEQGEGGILDTIGEVVGDAVDLVKGAASSVVGVFKNAKCTTREERDNDPNCEWVDESLKTRDSP